MFRNGRQSFEYRSRTGLPGDGSRFSIPSASHNRIRLWNQTAFKSAKLDIIRVAMGYFSSAITKFFSDARGAWDDIWESFRDNFVSDPRCFHLPKGKFKSGIAIVTPNEITDRHGTGVILARAFEGFDEILSIRTSNLHGEHSFGTESVRFFHQGLNRVESYAKLAHELRDNSFRYIICVPYHADDLLTAIILKDLFRAKLCVYIMDDNYLVNRRIPDDLMQEALEKSDLRLAISPEMRDAYEQRFNLEFWIRPPVVTSSRIREKLVLPSLEVLESQRGILVGTLWSNQILEQLAKAVSEAQIDVDWYGNSDASWLAFSEKQLAAKGVNPCGFISETELVAKLEEYAYAIIPSGTLDANDQRLEISKYSLPTRLPFLLAAGNIPMLVMGHRSTAAAAFVSRFDLGEVCSYDGSDLKKAIERLCSKSRQEEIRKRSSALANHFSAKGVGRWILDSMEAGKPVSLEMESLFE
jgi:hypothetical protein